MKDVQYGRSGKSNNYTYFKLIDENEFEKEWVCVHGSWTLFTNYVGYGAASKYQPETTLDHFMTEEEFRNEY